MASRRRNPLQATQQESIDFFRFYREGQAGEWNKWERQTTYRKIRPPAKLFDFPQSYKVDDIVRKRQRDHKQLFKYDNQKYYGRATREKKALDNTAKMIETLGKHVNIKMRKLLNYGGCGAAALADIVGSDGTKHTVVLKVPLDDGAKGEMVAERSIHRVLRHAKHAVQMVSSEAPMNPTTTTDEQDGHLLLEYLERGDLHQWICKATAEDVCFGDDVLWKIFECLIKAVIALQFPPATPSQVGEGSPIVSETMPQDCSVNKGANLVHFDMDPRNVFIGGFDSADHFDQEHFSMPIVKVGDFGHTRKVDEEFMKDALQMWKSRTHGKGTWYFPEQFSEEWEHIKEVPAHQPGGTMIAGRYTWWSNLYQAAQVMCCLITKQYPLYPPIPEYAEQILDFNSNVLPRFYSYGCHILGNEYSDIDYQLRSVIVRCLADKCEDRPSLKELERYLARKDAAVSKESREQTRQWAEKFFSSPPAPGEEAVIPTGRKQAESSLGILVGALERFRLASTKR